MKVSFRGRTWLPWKVTKNFKNELLIFDCQPFWLFRFRDTLFWKNAVWLQEGRNLEVSQWWSVCLRSTSWKKYLSEKVSTIAIFHKLWTITQIFLGTLKKCTEEFEGIRCELRSQLGFSQNDQSGKFYSKIYVCSQLVYHFDRYQNKPFFLDYKCW